MKFLMRWFSLVGLLCVLNRAHAETVAQAVAALPPQALAGWIAPVEGGAPLWQVRATTPMRPASTMKVLTTYAALALLGPQFHWTTDWLSTAPQQDDVLAGDLYWRGNGDPMFDRDSLASLARTVRARGIRVIQGDLLLDKSAFSTVGSYSELDSEQGRAYQVEPDPLLTNFKVVWLTLFAHDGAVRVALDPPLPGLTVRNQLTLGPGTCEGGVQRYVTHKLDGATLTLSGQFPAECDGQQIYASVFDHDQFQSQAFAAIWREAGGEWHGKVRRARTPEGARVLASHSSPPLAEVVYSTNKYSNNTMARQLLLTIGTQYPKTGNTLQDGISAIQTWLKSQGLDFPELRLENGSGLSRHEFITAEHLGELLQSAARSAVGPELLASLPIAAQDGTLAHRFVDSGINARMKTGTLNDVRALAGVVTVAGKRYVVVLIVNSETPMLHTVLDSVLEALAQGVLGKTVLVGP